MGKRADKNRKKTAKLQQRERRLSGMLRLGVDKETRVDLQHDVAKVVAEIENLEYARGKHQRHATRLRTVPSEPRHKRWPHAVALATSVRLNAAVTAVPLSQLIEAHRRAEDMLSTLASIGVSTRRINSLQEQLALSFYRRIDRLTPDEEREAFKDYHYGTCWTFTYVGRAAHIRTWYQREPHACTCVICRLVDARLIAREGWTK